MKRLLLIALLFILAIPVAEAKRRETEEEIARKTRNYEGWEWGASARASLIFYEMDYMKIKGQPSQMAYKSQAKFGGDVLLNAGYFLNNHWKLGAELGVQMQFYALLRRFILSLLFFNCRNSIRHNDNIISLEFILCDTADCNVHTVGNYAG